MKGRDTVRIEWTIHAHICTFLKPKLKIHFSKILCLKTIKNISQWTISD